MNIDDGYINTPHRKTKRNRGPKCKGKVKWFLREEKIEDCWHRCERNQEYCKWHLSPNLMSSWMAKVYAPVKEDPE